MNPCKGVNAALIQLCDIALAAPALVLLFPLFLVVSLLIVFDSPGKILFQQDRVGKAGKLFKILKFRTMQNIEKSGIPEYRRNSQGKPEPVIKIREDQRTTRFGFFLRRYSLDELPQFINILKGDMSLVGTRPPVPEEVEGYTAYQKKRLAGKPGLTGLAQINGRSDMDLDEIVRYDVYYIQNRSICLYLKILILTIPYVFTGKSAY